jgi:hypothetical protein
MTASPASASRSTSFRPRAGSGRRCYGPAAMADPPWTPPQSGHRALADRLAGAEVDPDSETVLAPRPASPAPSRGGRSKWPLVVAILVAVAALLVAVLDRRGKIAGVVYADELATGFGLAIPVDTVRRLVRQGGYEPVPPCGSG